MAVQDLYTAFLDLSRRARRANDVIELGFIAVNDTHLLAPYRQAALWFDDGGVRMLSGVLQPEANAPYVHWLKRVCRHLLDHQVGCREIQANDLPGEEADEWSEWLPAFALWFPLAAGQEADIANFAMFLWYQRVQPTVPAAEVEQAVHRNPPADCLEQAA